MKKSFFTELRYLYIAFFLFFLQFIIIDIYYFDDLFRAQHGYFGWKGDGRILGELFYSILLLFRNPLPDIYPIPLVVAGIIFCYMMYLSFLGFGVSSQKAQVAMMLVIISSPLALSNWLFRYDGAFMLLSIGFAFLPFYLADKSRVQWFILSLVSIIGVLCTYQSSINIYIGLTFIFCFKLFLNNKSYKEIFVYAMLSMLVFVIGYGIYSQIILKLYPTHDYAAKFRKIAPIGEMVYTVKTNFLVTYSIIKEVLLSGIGWLYLLGVILNLFLIIRYNLRNRLMTIIFYLIVMLFLFISVGGVMLISKSAPSHARVYTSFSVLLLYPYLVALFYKKQRVFFIFITPLLILLLVITRATLNSVSAEFKFHNSLSSQIRTELSMRKVDSYSNIIIVNNPKLTNVSQTNRKTFPIISRVLPTTFANGYDGGRFILMLNGFPYISYASTDKKDQLLEKLSDNFCLSQNHIYSLYLIDNVLVIYFK